MLLLLLILIVLAGVGGGFGHSRFGYVGWSPAAILLVVLVVFVVSGRSLHF